MDIVISNSTLFFRQPLPPVPTVSSFHKLNITTALTSSKNQLLFSPQIKLSLTSTNTSAVSRFTVSCGAAGPITEINQAQFPNTVLKSDRPVLVEFVANWCGPCRLIAPAMESIAQEYGDRLVVVKIDHDANPQLIEEYKVYGLPTLILFKNGKEVPESRREGAITKVKLKEYLDFLLESNSVA
ncbi:hypothetical protein ACOSP7_017614 [Xanthoceras sorbifolium]|uniref:Thioredoxin domain-containing protein n=1 Tax=Xanthoceras sorbifolium TaxID=99658 RepID=A0ABQ8I019_9ROSI|nr:hypothetical protein JRO89_XS05G0000400 [Xanthoceras sorbifolium]